MTHTATGAHTGTGHDDRAAADAVEGDGFGRFSGEMDAGKAERVAVSMKQRCGFAVVAFGMTPEYFGGGNRHRRIKKDLHGGWYIFFFHTLAQIIKYFLRPFHRKGGDNCIAASFEGVVDGVIQLLDTRLKLFVF